VGRTSRARGPSRRLTSALDRAHWPSIDPDNFRSVTVLRMRNGTSMSPFRLALGDNLLCPGRHAVAAPLHCAERHSAHNDWTASCRLSQEVLPHVPDVPLFVARGIATGRAIVAATELGASGSQIETRFACASESPAHPDFKAALMRAQARDPVVSAQRDPRLKSIPVRALSNRVMAAFMEIQRELLTALDVGDVTPAQAQERIDHSWAERLRRAVMSGDVQEGTVMAGQSVALDKEEQSTRAVRSDTDGASLRFVDVPQHVSR